MITWHKKSHIKIVKQVLKYKDILLWRWITFLDQVWSREQRTVAIRFIFKILISDHLKFRGDGGEGQQDWPSGCVIAIVTGYRGIPYSPWFNDNKSRVRIRRAFENFSNPSFATVGCDSFWTGSTKTNAHNNTIVHMPPMVVHINTPKR